MYLVHFNFYNFKSVTRTKDVTSFVECLASVHDALNSVTVPHKPSVLVLNMSHHLGFGGKRIGSSRSCLSTWQVQGQPGLPETPLKKSNTLVQLI